MELENISRIEKEKNDLIMKMKLPVVQAKMMKNILLYFNGVETNLKSIQSQIVIKMKKNIIITIKSSKKKKKKKMNEDNVDYKFIFILDFINIFYFY